MHSSPLKEQKKILHFCIYLFAAIAIAVIFASTSHAATYTVTKTEDTADGTCDADCSLREAIIAANAGDADTIVIPAGTYTFTRAGDGENSASTGDLDLTDSDTTIIQGAGSGLTIIDADDLDRVFDMRSGSSAEFHDLTMQNGNTEDEVGGGFYMLSSTVVMDNVIIQNNEITDVFEFSQGAGIFCSGGSLTMTNSTISGNSSEDAIFGAGLYVSQECDIDISQTTISGNSTPHVGGGIYVTLDTDQTKEIDEVTFTNNSADSGGGGMYVAGGTTSLALNLTNSVFDANSSTVAGGGIYALGRLDATNLTLHENTTTGSGGGIYLPNQTYVDVVISHSTIVQNESDSDDDGTGTGGGIAIGGTSVDLTINGTIIAANSSNSANGPDCFAAGGLTSADYNLIDDDSNCTFTAQDNDIIEAASASIFATGILEDLGGNVQSFGVGSLEITDAVPAAACLDAEGDPLTRDARGLTRPENTNCDMGSFERDLTDPVVSLTAGTDTIECSVDTWTDAGATATDNFRSGITVSASGSVTEETVNTYTITYTSSADYDGNTGTNTRTVTVQDTTTPTLTLNGESSLTVGSGETYTDAGASVSDTCDNDISVTTSGGTIDTTVAGTYTVQYTATDDSGNQATASRTVTVLGGGVPLSYISSRYGKTSTPPQEDEYVPSFPDIENHKNQTAIDYLFEQGVISGYPDGEFKPNGLINRAELLKILVASNGIDPLVEDFNNCFNDVSDQWFAPYVCYAKDQGWVHGYEDGSFRPESKVNKAEAIKMLINSQEIQLSELIENEIFTDYDPAAWYAPYIQTAKDHNILEKTTGFYGLAQSITRGELSENLYRALSQN